MTRPRSGVRYSKVSPTRDKRPLSKHCRKADPSSCLTKAVYTKYLEHGDVYPQRPADKYQGPRDTGICDIGLAEVTSVPIMIEQSSKRQ